MGIKIVALDSGEETKGSKKRRTRERIAKEEKSFAARTGSDADKNRLRERLMKKLDSTQSANSISDKDLKILEEAYIKRNDGGMAMSGRGKPVRTF